MSDENGDEMVSAEEARQDIAHIRSRLGSLSEPAAGSVRCSRALLEAYDQILDLARTVIALHKRLEGVGVVECLAARDAATRERARADKAERERDAARETNKRLHRRTQQTEADVESLRCIVPVGAPHRSDVVEFLRAYSVAAKVWKAAGRPVFPGQSGVGGLWPLHEWVAHVASERDRLARILAVERGDESQAPEGWERKPSGRWVKRRPATATGGVRWENASVWRDNTGWFWSVRGSEDAACGSALEGMEAADAAREPGT